MRNTCQKKGSGIIAMLMIFQFFACKESHEQIPDVGKVKVDLKWYRFEKELSDLDSANLRAGIQKICAKHPAFCDLYFNSVLNLPFHIDSLTDDFVKNLKLFLYHPSSVSILEKIKRAIPEEDILRKQFEQSLKYFKYYFPEIREPVFYTAYCDFAYGHFIFNHESGSDGLGIGLEFFGGDQIDYRSVDPENPVFSDYLSRSFNADHLLPRTWDAWLDDRIQIPASGQLLDYMIQRGKKLYILDHLLPEVADTAIFDLSSNQLQWCRRNKMEIWSFFLSQQLLYSSELMKINKYINPSPNSPGMPAEAPGRTGSYLGYELVKSYFKNNPGTSLKSLLEETDSQVFLQKSRFKPRND